MKKYSFLTNATHGEVQVDNNNRNYVDIVVNSKKYTVYEDGTVIGYDKNGRKRKLHSFVDNYGVYHWMHIGNKQVARHVLVAYAFGLMDNIDNIQNYDICHKLAKLDGGTDHIDNLMIDTHEFNIQCASLSKRLKNKFDNNLFSIDRTNYEELLALVS
jgi:hypothetical protein